MRYLYRRIAFYLIALWTSLTLNFFLPRLMPGNPVDYFAATHQSEIQNNPHLL